MPCATDSDGLAVDKLDRIFEALQLLNVNLENLRVTLATQIQVADDHEQRLRSIERWHNSLTPVLAAITFTLGAVVSITLDRLL